MKAKGFVHNVILLCFIVKPVLSVPAALMSQKLPEQQVPVYVEEFGKGLKVSIPKSEREKINENERRIVPKCGHYGWPEQEDLYIDSVHKFLNKI